MGVKSRLKDKMSRLDWIYTRFCKTANCFYCLKASYYIRIKLYLLFFCPVTRWLCTARPAVCVYACASVCVMDVLLLSFEARCILDGIRRRLKKTGSSLSPPSTPSSRGTERDMDAEKDRKIDGDGWMDSQRKIECCLKGSGPGGEWGMRLR